MINVNHVYLVLRGICNGLFIRGNCLHFYMSCLLIIMDSSFSESCLAYYVFRPFISLLLSLNVDGYEHSLYRILELHPKVKSCDSYDSHVQSFGQVDSPSQWLGVPHETPWILHRLSELTKVFLSISSINAMWKNENLSPIPKHFTTDLSAQGVKLIWDTPKCGSHAFPYSKAQNILNRVLSCFRFIMSIKLWFPIGN